CMASDGALHGGLGMTTPRRFSRLEVLLCVARLQAPRPLTRERSHSSSGDGGCLRPSATEGGVRGAHSHSAQSVGGCRISPRGDPHARFAATDLPREVLGGAQSGWTPRLRAGPRRSQVSRVSVAAVKSAVSASAAYEWRTSPCRTLARP